MSDLFNELVEDMRADRAHDLWRRYGKWVLYTAVSIILVTAAMVYWQQHQRNRAMLMTSYLFAATDALAKGDAKLALESLAQIRVPSNSAYHGLVLLETAQAQQALGQEKEAQATLLELANHRDVYGDIGAILTGNSVLAGEPKEYMLAYTRMEWAAWDLIKQGKKNEAAQAFQHLSKEERAPQTMRDRAQMMSVSLAQSAEQSHE